MKSALRQVAVETIEPKLLAVAIALLFNHRPPPVLIKRELFVGGRLHATGFDRALPRIER